MAEGMTNKELMLQMFEMQKESAVNTQEIKINMKQLADKVAEHDEALKKLEKIPEEIKTVKDLVTEIKKKSDDKDSKLEERITTLENKSGKNAIAVWKMIGSVALGALVTAIFTAIWAFFMNK